MNTMLDLAVLVLLGWGTSLETQPARAATGTVEDLRQFEKKLQEAVRRAAPAVVGVSLSARDAASAETTFNGIPTARSIAVTRT